MSKIDDNFWYNYLKVYDILNDAYPYVDLLKEVIKNISVNGETKILDAGSGTGNYSIKLAELGGDVYSIDNSKIGLDMHINKYPGAKTIHHDLNDSLPFNDNNFDYIISLNTICFIEKDKREKIFKEFYRVLKPEGKIVCVNLLYYFKPFKIFIAHIRKDIKLNGFLKAMIYIIKKINPILKMFYYTNMIKRYGQNNEFFLLDEQYNYLKSANFNDITESKLVFGNQAVLNVALK